MLKSILTTAFRNIIRNRSFKVAGFQSPVTGNRKLVTCNHFEKSKY